VGKESAVDLSTAIAKLMRHRQWEEVSLRFVAGNAELIEETRETTEIGERLFRKVIIDAEDTHKTKH
jgi:hypothetical protein